MPRKYVPKTAEEKEANRFKITRDSLRKLYEETDRQLEKGITWSPPESVVRKIKKFFRDDPFAKLRWGLLRIVDRKGELVWFDLNEEQQELQEHLDYCWSNRLPCEFEILKARQIGCSTWAEGAHYSYCSSLSHKKGHLVADLIDKCKQMMRIFLNFWKNEPAWLRPKIEGKNPLHFDDEWIDDTFVLFESAERGEKIGRAFTFQFDHWSELGFWNPTQQQAIISSLKKTMAYGWPCIRIVESSGRAVNDAQYQRYFLAKDGKLGSAKAFFFAWFKHREYRLPLPLGVSKEQFWENDLSEQDKEMVTTYGLDIEQINWYVTMRQSEILDEGSTLDLFRREYPSNEEEAFLGSNTNFFDPGRNAKDKARTREKGMAKVPIAMLPTSCTSAVGGDLVVSRCRLFTDEAALCARPEFFDDILGEWRVWETYRRGHKYLVTADSARGVLAEKNRISSRDWSVCDVWRYTYEDGEHPVFVQVAQFRSQSCGPRELAQHAVAASVLYGDPVSRRKALLVPENNSFGLALIEEAKDLGANFYQRIIKGKLGEEIGRELGFTTTTGATAQGAKVVLMTNLRKAWQAGLVQVNSAQTADEMGTFVNNNGKLEAMSPHHDDTVITAALCIEGIDYLERAIAPIRIIGNAALRQTRGDDYDPEDDIPKINVRQRRRMMLGREETEDEKADAEMAGWL